MVMGEPPNLPTPGSEESKERKRNIPVPVVAGALFAVALLAALYVLSTAQQASPPPPPSEEDLAYTSNLDISDLALSAEENFLGQQLVYLDGKITNQGERILQRLRLRLHFRDYMNQVVLREEREVLSAQAAPLRPGGTREFQLRFDNLPESWNRQFPQFQLVSIGLGPRKQ